jgi:hypothetical protein
MAPHSALLMRTPSSGSITTTQHRHRRRTPTPTLAARAPPSLPPLRATAAERQQQQAPVDVDTGEPDALELKYGWKGADDFSSLNDRVDAPPPPLPPLKRRCRVVLVRHGQSTWNAEGRVQGSSDGSELTDKGKAQARAAGEMVRSVKWCDRHVGRRQTTTNADGGRALTLARPQKKHQTNKNSSPASASRACSSPPCAARARRPRPSSRITTPTSPTTPTAKSTPPKPPKTPEARRR